MGDPDDQLALLSFVVYICLFRGIITIDSFAEYLYCLQQRLNRFRVLEITYHGLLLV